MDAHTLHMGDKVIYVRAEDEPLWDWAVAYVWRSPHAGIGVDPQRASGLPGAGRPRARTIRAHTAPTAHSQMTPPSQRNQR